jgi:hypothetical protein
MRARIYPVGAGNSSGHPEQAFRAASSDPSRCRPSALSSPGSPDERAGLLRRGDPERFDPRVHPLRRARCRARQRQDDSGGSRTTGDPSHHARRSGKAAGQRSGRVFGTHRSRTRTRNGGPAPSAANCATAPSSGTAETSNGSSPNTSSTTTRTAPTAASANAHQTMPKSSRIGPASRANDTPPAADSSTSTAKQPERLRQRPTHHLYVSFDAPAPPPTRRHQRRRRSPNTPNAFPAPTGSL